MNWTSLSKPLLRFAGALAVLLPVYWSLRLAGLHQFTARDIEGLNTLILLLGSIYSVIFAFVIFVIWGQFTEVENLAIRECNSLNDLLRLSRYINADANHSIRRTAGDYAQSVMNSEWQALANRERDPQTERFFTAVTTAVMRAVPANPSEAAIHERLIDVARITGQHRDERVAKSLSRIPGTLGRFVRIMETGLLALVFVYPFHNTLTGACCFVLIALVLFLADTVMTDTDNPFEGVCNVSAQPFSELML